MPETGPLTPIVLQYQDIMKQLVPVADGRGTWAPLERFVDIPRFRRIGTFLETHDWVEYVDMLTRWARATDSFDTTVHRISEINDLVYFEIEERHFSNGRVVTVNSMTVFEFDTSGKICGLKVYLQQAK